MVHLPLQSLLPRTMEKNFGKEGYDGNLTEIVPNRHGNMQGRRPPRSAEDKDPERAVTLQTT